MQPRKQFDSKFIKSMDAQKENELKLELALEAKRERDKIEVRGYFSTARSIKLACQNRKKRNYQMMS